MVVVGGTCLELLLASCVVKAAVLVEAHIVLLDRVEGQQVAHIALDGSVEDQAVAGIVLDEMVEGRAEVRSDTPAVDLVAVRICLPPSSQVSWWESLAWPFGQTQGEEPLRASITLPSRQTQGEEADYARELRLSMSFRSTY